MAKESLKAREVKRKKMVERCGGCFRERDEQTAANASGSR